MPVRGRFILFWEAKAEDNSHLLKCKHIDSYVSRFLFIYWASTRHWWCHCQLFTLEYLIHLVRWKLCGISNLSIHQDEYLVDKLHPNIFHLNTVHLFSTVYFDLKRSSCVRVRQQLVCVFTFLLLKVVPINLYFKVF